MARLTVAGTTEVIIQDELPARLLPERTGRRRVAILTQPTVTEVASDVADRIGSESLMTEVIEVPDREEAKTLGVAERIYADLARIGLSRGDTIVGVGGGAATDLAGFLAATWMRGVESVYVPTTLLCAVDASIGGKTGVNVMGKNLVGVFWHPSRVNIGIEILEALPPQLIREGLAEALKTGLIGDPQLCHLLESSGPNAPLDDVVFRSIKVKGEIVSLDYRERGQRAFLNFGHTIGHGLEYASGLPHGEAVSLGMIAEAAISEARLGFDNAHMVGETLGLIGLPTSVDGMDAERVIDLIRLDKKQDSEGLRVVLLRQIGEPVVEHVDDESLHLGLSAIGI